MPATIIIAPRDIVSKRERSIVVALKNDKIPRHCICTRSVWNEFKRPKVPRRTRK